MNTPAEKTQENKNQSVANRVFQMQSGSESTFQFVDDRPEIVNRRKLKEIANNSPQVKQLRAFQEMANNSPQAKQAAQLEAMAGNFSAGQRYLKQGRVKPKMQMQMKDTVTINHDAGLKKEADSMGKKVTLSNLNGPEQNNVSSSKSIASVAQLKIGRTDGSDDMNADQIKNWLTNAGLWKSIEGRVLDMLEAMMQSDHQWMYSGMGAVQLILDAKDLMTDVHYNQGLIHGDLRRGQNETDFHVNPGDGKNLISDMLAVAQDSYEKMTIISKLPGRPNGRIYLRPQGAAIIKIVSQTLGEALGNRNLIEVARNAIYYRKIKEKAIALIPFYKKESMSKEIVDKSIVSEHSAYIKSLVGAVGIDIKPLLPGTTTLAEFTQNMLESSIAGQQRLARYINTVEEGKIPVSMDIYIDRNRLPDIINLLRNQN